MSLFCYVGQAEPKTYHTARFELLLCKGTWNSGAANSFCKRNVALCHLLVTMLSPASCALPWVHLSSAAKPVFESSLGDFGGWIWIPNFRNRQLTSDNGRNSAQIFTPSCHFLALFTTATCTPLFPLLIITQTQPTAYICFNFTAASCHCLALFAAATCTPLSPSWSSRKHSQVRIFVSTVFSVFVYSVSCACEKSYHCEQVARANVAQHVRWHLLAIWSLLVEFVYFFFHQFSYDCPSYDCSTLRMTALRSSFQLSYSTDLLQLPNLDSSWQILGILNIHPTWGIHNQCNNNRRINNTIKRIKQLYLYMISNNINKVDTNFKSIRAQAKLVQVLTHKCHVPILITAFNYHHHRHHDQTNHLQLVLVVAVRP